LATEWVKAKPYRFYPLILALAVLPLSVFVVGSHKVLLQLSTNRLVTQSSQTGKLIGDLLVQQFTENTQLLQSFAGRADLLRAVESNHPEQILPHLEAAQRLHSEFTAVAFYDATGKLTATFPPAPSTKTVSPVNASSSTYVSSLYRNARGEWVVAVVVPVRNQQGQLLGHLVAEQTPQSATKKIYVLLTDSATNLSFIDQAGHIFGRQDKSITVIQSPAEISDFIALKANHNVGKIIPVGKEDSLVAYVPIESLRWGVLLQVQMKALKAALWRYEKGLLILGVIILLIALGGGAFVVSLYRQLRESDHQIHLESSSRCLCCHDAGWSDHALEF